MLFRLTTPRFFYLQRHRKCHGWAILQLLIQWRFINRYFTKQVTLPCLLTPMTEHLCGQTSCNKPPSTQPNPSICYQTFFNQWDNGFPHATAKAVDDRICHTYWYTAPQKNYNCVARYILHLKCWACHPPPPPSRANYTGVPKSRTSELLTLDLEHIFSNWMLTPT